MLDDRRPRSTHSSFAASPNRSLQDGFLRSAVRSPERPALEIDGEVVTYRALSARARAVAATLGARSPEDAIRLTGVFAERSVTMFTGILASLFRGHGYVPLSPHYPAARSLEMLERAQCRSIVVAARDAERLDGVLQQLTRPVVVVVPDLEDVEGLVRQWPAHTVLGTGDLLSADDWRPPAVTPDAPAYVLFTSGSTGSPKGVIVSQANVAALVDAAVDRFEITEDDRFSQTFDVTFDLSAFDMFVAWERGACIVCPPVKGLISPAKYIRDSRLTVWFSVPSVAVLMQKLNTLKPNALPGLRWSLFCGEALPVDVVASWVDAAPGSIVENLYGPTEATIFCTAYRWDPARSPAESAHGIVPIGEPLPRMSAVIVDEALREVLDGEEGELLVSGPQVSLGYLDDPAKTAASFVQLDGRPGLHYRTGDRVLRPVDDGPLVFLGRLDDQVKILGHRVELGEIEAALRAAAGVQAAVALGWPKTASGAAGVIGFVQGTALSGPEIRDAVAGRLPAYMVPREVRVVEALPLTGNGKIDRAALLRSLEAPV